MVLNALRYDEILNGAESGIGSLHRCYFILKLDLYCSLTLSKMAVESEILQVNFLV